MKIGTWHVGPNDSKLHGISDTRVLDVATLSLARKAKNSMILVGLTLEGTRTWSLEGELKEMKGYLRGMIRSKHGREMLDARKMNIAYDLRLVKR